MKALRYFVLVGLLFCGAVVFAQEKIDSFKVYGNCGMCKSRVEKAAKSVGATSAVWNKDTKIMTVSFDPSQTNTDAIQKKIAAVGHDTDLYSASDKVYEKLPGCCLYDRKAEGKKD